MTKKELLTNDGYWEATIELVFFRYKGKKLEKEITKSMLKLKNELIENL